MPSSQTSKVLALVGFGAAIVVVACYNPDIDDGVLQCAPLPQKQCPDDFECRADNRCYKQGGGVGGVGGSATGGMIGTGGMPGTGGMMSMGGMPGVGGAGGMCVMPIPGCKPSASAAAACDEVCQTGCGCNERCTLSGRQVSCQPDSGGRQRIGDACSGTTPDTCAPGLLCLDEPEPVCGRRCFRYCTDDSDCTEGAHCTVPLVLAGTGEPEETGVKVCDVPPEACSPIFGEGKCKRSDRPGDAYGCYLMGTGFPNATVCDCAGTLAEDAPCEVERECLPGLFCVTDKQLQNTCKRVCPLDQPAVARGICGMGKTCTAFQGSIRWGTCL